MSELERLRADQEVLERYFCDGCAKVVRDKIAALEAEADPWREAKGWVSSWRGQDDYPVVVKYIDHLAAENARLEKRVAEWEAEDTADVADAEAALAKGEFVPFEDMQPPFDRAGALSCPRASNGNWHPSRQKGVSGFCGHLRRHV